MKKNVYMLTIALIILAAMFGVDHSYAYTLNDPVGDCIGSAYFEMYGMNVSQVGDDITFDIYSNYPGVVTVGNWRTFSGDLALDVNKDGIYEYGLAMTSHDGLVQGGLYNVSGWYTSNHYALSGYSYNKNQIVTISAVTGAAIAVSPVVLNGPQSTYPRYQLSATLDANDFLPEGFDGKVNVFYSLATCSNDNLKGSVAMKNPVPEPATMLLLGPALLGLLGLRKKEKTV